MALRQENVVSHPGFYTFLSELHVYLSAVSQITLNATSSIRVIDSLASATATQNLGRTEGSGVLLGCASDLFQMIPRITASFRDKLIPTLSNGGYMSEAEHLAASKYLEYSIIMWSPPSVSSPEFIACGLLYQQALLIFLYASRYGRDTENPDFRSLTQECLEQFIEMLDELKFDSNPSATTLIWPLTIAGSCALQPTHRKRILDVLKEAFVTTSMQPSLLISRVLKLLWASSEAYGPIGLEDIMFEHDIHPSIG